MAVYSVHCAVLVHAATKVTVLCVKNAQQLGQWPR